MRFYLTFISLLLLASCSTIEELPYPKEIIGKWSAEKYEVMTAGGYPRIIYSDDHVFYEKINIKKNNKLVYSPSGLDDKTSSEFTYLGKHENDTAIWFDLEFRAFEKQEKWECIYLKNTDEIQVGYLPRLWFSKN